MPTQEEYAAWCSQLMAAPSFEHHTTSKGGKPKTMDLRPALLSLFVAPPQLTDQRHVTRDGGGLAPGTAVLHFTGRVGVDENNQGLLGPDLLAVMLSRVAGAPVEVLNTHRLCIATLDAPWSEEQAATHAAQVEAAKKGAAPAAHAVAR